ncbi:MAG: zinc-finger domain-containing protein [Gammaproteobacteria bacterium]|nr:zinc-finger domain-containing protein [Gammaproteobacteria bacterium]
MNQTKKTAQQKAHVVTSKDLPLSCPMAGAPLWSQHPRVFLPIDRTGEAVCPYCSAKYVLKDHS